MVLHLQKCQVSKLSAVSALIVLPAVTATSVPPAVTAPSVSPAVTAPSVSPAVTVLSVGAQSCLTNKDAVRLPKPCFGF